MELVSELRPSSPDDAEQIFSLMREANAYSLQQSGEVQWEEDFGFVNMSKSIEEGDCYVVQEGDEIVAGVVLQAEDPDIWGAEGLDNQAVYVHKLMARSSVRGGGMGRFLLRFAAEEAQGLDRDLVRLDCRASQAGLRGYYEGLGFEYVRDLEASSAKYARAALYQIAARDLLEI